MNRRELDISALVRAYEGGESEKSLAGRLGVSRPVIHRRLTEAGVATRGVSEANRLSMAQRTPEQNRRNTEAAHSAVRGKRQTLQHREAIARTIERQGGTNVSPAERQLSAMLTADGYEVTPQLAVGPYNVDIAIGGTVAVEVFGGGGHGTGPHASRHAKRSRHILDTGLNLLIVVYPTKNVLTADGYSEVVAFTEATRSDPAFRRQYRVIRCDGQPCAWAALKLDDLASEG